MNIAIPILLCSCIAAIAGGCTLVVDFDRSLLVDAGADSGTDAGQDAALDEAANESVDAEDDAAVDFGDDSG